MGYVITPITSLNEADFNNKLHSIKTLYAGSGSMGTNVYLTEDFDRIATRIIARRAKKQGLPMGAHGPAMGTAENPETEIYLIEDRESGELLGGLEYEYFSEIQCGFVGYLILAKHLWEEKRKDKNSLPKRVELHHNEALVQALRETFDRHLLNAQDFDGVRLIFSEVFRPAFIRNENIPATQLNFFKKLGFLCLDIDYIQPPLEQAKSPVDKLLLLVYKPLTEGISKYDNTIQLSDFEAFYQAMATSTGALSFFENRIDGIRNELLARNGQLDYLGLDRIPFFELEEQSVAADASYAQVVWPLTLAPAGPLEKRSWVLKDGEDVLAGLELVFSKQESLAFVTAMYDTERANFYQQVDESTAKTNLYRLLTHPEMLKQLKGVNTFMAVESPYNCTDDLDEDLESEVTPFEALDKKLRLFYAGPKTLAKWVSFERADDARSALSVAYGKDKELYILYLSNDNQGFVLKQDVIGKALSWACTDAQLRLIDGKGRAVDGTDGRSVTSKPYMPGHYYLKEVPKFEKPGIHIQRGSLCYHLAIDEDYLSPQLLAPRNEDPYCNFFHSFETDLFDYKHQSNAPYFTKRFTPATERADQLLGEIKVRFKVKTEYTSEGRVETFFTRRNAMKECPGLEGGALVDLENAYREITFKVFLHFTYFTKSKVRVWHLVLRTREDNEVTDLDFIKLIKYFSTLQEWDAAERKHYLQNNIQFYFNDLKPVIGYEYGDTDPGGLYRGDRWQVPNIDIRNTNQLFQAIFHLSGVVYTQQEQGEKGTRNRPLRLDDFEVSSGIVQIDTKYIELNDANIDLSVALTKMFEHMNEEKALQSIQGIGLDFQKAAYVFESITGICHGIFDFWRLGIEEISDTLDPVNTSENLFLVLNRGVLGGVAYDEELYATAWDNIGISPYLIVPSAVLAHNECVVRDAELQLNRFLDYYEKVWVVHDHCKGWSKRQLRKDLLGLLWNCYDGVTVQKIGNSQRTVQECEAICGSFIESIIADTAYFDRLQAQWNDPQGLAAEDRDKLLLVKSLVPAVYPKQSLELFFHSEKLGEKQLEISRVVENDIVSNIFQYATERGLYDVGMEKRGITERYETVKYLLDRVEQEKGQLKDREQKQTDVFQEVFLAFIALFGIVSALKDLSDFLDSENSTKKPLLTLICVIISIALIYIIRYYRANRDRV